MEYSDNKAERIKILHGDAYTVLKTLPDESVQCCITSPPYYLLRNYGIDGQIGIEPLHDCLGWATGNNCGKCYICHLRQVFSEVKRVLRRDGTLWLNIGDSYAGSGKAGNNPEYQKQHTEFGKSSKHKERFGPSVKPTGGLKNKDLMGIPWRTALALQADGWWLRSDIIWNKRRVMPESVTDRPTKGHEYIFLLTKSAKYFYDYFAIREKAVCPAGSKGGKGSKKRSSTNGVNSRPQEYAIYDGYRNKRTVWDVLPQGFKGYHFATFPEELIRPMILAGTSEKGRCANCGSPYVRKLEKTNDKIELPNGNLVEIPVTKTIGWEKTCKCNCSIIKPCVVLDPFNGSGTTGVVAIQHGVDYIGIEIKKEYIEMSEKRISKILGGKYE